METEAAQIVHCSMAPTLAARSEFIMCDWHTLLLFISCLEYSNAFCALCSLALLLTVLVFPSPSVPPAPLLFKTKRQADL